MSTPTRYLKVLQELDKDMSLDGAARAGAAAANATAAPSGEAAAPSQNAAAEDPWASTLRNMTHKVS